MAIAMEFMRSEYLRVRLRLLRQVPAQVELAALYPGALMAESVESWGVVLAKDRFTAKQLPEQMFRDNSSISKFAFKENVIYKTATGTELVDACRQVQYVENSEGTEERRIYLEMKSSSTTTTDNTLSHEFFVKLVNGIMACDKKTLAVVVVSNRDVSGWDDPGKPGQGSTTADEWLLTLMEEYSAKGVALIVYDEQLIDRYFPGLEHRLALAHSRDETTSGDGGAAAAGAAGGGCGGGGADFLSLPPLPPLPQRCDAAPAPVKSAAAVEAAAGAAGPGGVVSAARAAARVLGDLLPAAARRGRPGKR